MTPLSVWGCELEKLRASSVTGILDVAVTDGANGHSATYGQDADSGTGGEATATASPLEVHDGLMIERLIKSVDSIIDRELAEPEDLGGYPDPVNERFA